VARILQRPPPTSHNPPETEIERKSELIPKKIPNLEGELQRCNSYLKSAKNVGAFDFRILQWMLAWTTDSKTKSFDFPSEVLIIGDGPYGWNDFLKILESINCDAYSSNSEPTWIIIGQENWTEELIERLIDERSGREIKIVSQELFVAGLLSDQDPFDASPDILRVFGENHPALNYLMNSGFEWPIVQGWINEAPKIYNFGGVDQSPLASLGYHVGLTKSIRPAERRRILNYAFSESIPNVGPSDYMDEWGNPCSRKRLWRIAHHIAWLANNRRSNAAMEHAVAHWVEDLHWLKTELFKPSMRFQWPNTFVI
jgi:hypothetical protein